MTFYVGFAVGAFLMLVTYCISYAIIALTR